MDEDTRFSISELASEFEISSRTIRFYEEKKLLAPTRSAGNQRTYGKKDRARLKLILRGKRIGLSLKEIIEILGEPDHHLPEDEQIKLAMHYGKKYYSQIKTKIEELQELEKEMFGWEKKMKKRLEELEVENQPTQEEEYINQNMRD